MDRGGLVGGVIFAPFEFLREVVVDFQAVLDAHIFKGEGNPYFTSFKVLARRTDTRGARTVTVPYFVTVLRGGTAVVSKRVGEVTLTFADGAERASAAGAGSAYIDKAEATIPADIRERITRKRKAGDADAAVDPLSQPDVKAAVARATFEVLVGFQLTQDQLTYNATR